MMHALGPRTSHIFDLLQSRILSGELKPGARLPPHIRLAADFGVAPMTIRNVLGRLEAAGLVSRELGRGTFVRGSSARLAVLVVAGAHLQEALGEHVRRSGLPLISAAAPADALGILNTNRSIGLVLCDLAAPAAGPVAEFIRGVRRRWPRLPVAVVTTSPSDLDALFGAPECPVLLMPTPIQASQIDEVFRLALPEAVEQAVVATDSQARILYWNRGAERLYGWAAEEVLGRRVAEVIGAPKLLERGLGIMTLLRDGKSWTGELSVCRRDGTPLRVLVTDSPIRDSDGQLVGIMSISVEPRTGTRTSTWDGAPHQERGQ